MSSRIHTPGSPPQELKAFSASPVLLRQIKDVVDNDYAGASHKMIGYIYDVWD